jgi:hypothetical protein
MSDGQAARAYRQRGDNAKEARLPGSGKKDCLRSEIDNSVQDRVVK